jgi:hypothetical protein
VQRIQGTQYAYLDVVIGFIALTSQVPIIFSPRSGSCYVVRYIIRRDCDRFQGTGTFHSCMCIQHTGIIGHGRFVERRNNELLHRHKRARKSRRRRTRCTAPPRRPRPRNRRCDYGQASQDGHGIKRHHESDMDPDGYIADSSVAPGDVREEWEEDG